MEENEEQTELVSSRYDHELNAYVTTVHSDVDIMNYRDVVAHIDSLPLEKARFLVLDIGPLERIASIGIGLIYHTLDVVSSQKRILFLIASQRLTRYALDLCGASTAVKVFSDMEDVRSHIEESLEHSDDDE